MPGKCQKQNNFAYKYYIEVAIFLSIEYTAVYNIVLRVDKTVVDQSNPKSICRQTLESLDQSA